MSLPEDVPMFDEQGNPTVDVRKGRHRRNDWVTSVEGATKVAYRAGTQKARLLEVFKAAFPDNLTDEEAAYRARIPMSSEYSKRCGELRQDGVIAVVYESPGKVLTRMGGSGVHRIVSVWVEEQ